MLIKEKTCLYSSNCSLAYITIDCGREYLSFSSSEITLNLCGGPRLLPSSSALSHEREDDGEDEEKEHEGLVLLLRFLEWCLLLTRLLLEFPRLFSSPDLEILLSYFPTSSSSLFWGESSPIWPEDSLLLLSSWVITTLSAGRNESFMKYFLFG